MGELVVVDRRTGVARRGRFETVLLATVRRLGVALVLLGLVVPAAAIRVQNDLVGEGWLEGGLTWGPDGGGVSWRLDESPQPVGGRLATDESAPRTFDAFVTDPLPVTLYLNASRMIQLDLFLRVPPEDTDPPCHGPEPATSGAANPGIRVLIASEGDFLTGANDGTDVKWAQWGRPRVPEGYQLCTYRMPAELSFLPAGARLTIRLEYYRNLGPYAYGMVDPQRSVLRLPHYLPEEAFYRVPGLTREVRSPPSPPESLVDQIRGELPGGTWLAALGPFLITPRTRGREGRKAAAAIALVAFVIAAGCLHPPSARPMPTSTGPASVRISYHDPGESGLANASVGSVLGVVSDANQIPVRDAFVALLGSPHSARTDPHGQFSLLGVAPRLYTMRVDKEGFHSLETRVAVVAGNVTRVDATLETIAPLDPDRRPHRHDYWDGQDQIVVMNRTVTANLDGCIADLPAQDAGYGDLIIPGTELVEVNLTWTGSQTELELAVQANHPLQAGPAGASNYSVYMARPQGQPFRILANWEMTDFGHQTYSTWQLRPQGCPTGLRAIVTLHRGVLPLEPPHPDYWGSAAELEVDADKTRSVGITPATCYLNAPFAVARTALGNPRGWMDPIDTDLGTPGHVVPPESQSLRIVAGFNRANGVADAATFGWILWYKPGSSPARTYIPSNLAGFLQAPDATASPDGKSFTWTLPLAAGQADPIYHRKSGWQFGLQPSDDDALCTDSTAVAPALGALVLDRWNVTAVRGTD